MNAATRGEGSLPPDSGLAAAPVPWTLRTNSATAAGEDAAARVMFHSWILRRNFAGFPFWVSSSPETCARIAERARAHAALRGFEAGVTLAALEPRTRGILRERMLLPEQPVSFPGKRDFKMLFARSAETGVSEHALLGETEHWTRIRTEGGAPSAEIPTGPSPLSEFLHAEETREPVASGRPSVFSRSTEWGLLTSDPSFAGNGLQGEAGIHLPGLTAARKIPQVRQAMAAMGLELSPLSLRAPGAAEAGYFRLRSRGGMDLSSEDLRRRFTGKLKTLLDAETGAWERWNARDPNLLEDRMHRALRLLQEARRMEFAEMLFLTSFARAGVYKGIFAVSLLPKLETLRVTAQPAHLAANPAPEDAPVPHTGPGEASERENARRALLGRTLLAGA